MHLSRYFEIFDEMVYRNFEQEVFCVMLRIKWEVLEEMELLLDVGSIWPAPLGSITPIRTEFKESMVTKGNTIYI